MSDQAAVNEWSGVGGGLCYIVFVCCCCMLLLLGPKMGEAGLPYLLFPCCVDLLFCLLSGCTGARHRRRLLTSSLKFLPLGYKENLTSLECYNFVLYSNLILAPNIVCALPPRPDDEGGIELDTTPAREVGSDEVGVVARRLR